VTDHTFIYAGIRVVLAKTRAATGCEVRVVEIIVFVPTVTAQATDRVKVI
jgi:hypothetical protein